ncbi:hypothetical protein [Pseudomonas sp. LT1P18]|uniref:hypothetical protein n=1 Tax=Pseudomonas arabinosi TaxID=3398357 RepID=UPI0039F0C71B
MVLGHKNVLGRTALALVVSVSSFSLAGCGGGNEQSNSKDASAKQSSERSDPTDKKATDEAVLSQLAQENTPRMVTFTNPGVGDLASYLDAKQPMIVFNMYNAKRDWPETPEDIADSMGDPFAIRGANPDLYRIATERQSAKDSFKKKDLATELNMLVSKEAESIGQSNLVKLSSDDWTPIALSTFDQSAKGFRIDNCLFSDKLEYNDEERRSSTTLARAPKIRCYLNPGPTNYFIGFQGGSGLLLDVSDESLARVIEAQRETIKIDIYGYVKSVARERFAGEFGPQRFVLIAPQRIDLKDGVTGKVIYTKNI